MIRFGAKPGAARTGLVLLHGRGGSAADILGLAQALNLPGLAALAPEAPGNSWWPTSFLAPMAQMEAPLNRALTAVAAAIATFEAEGLPRSRIALAGFSQGACLALECAARHGAGLLDVTGFSGGLVGTADAEGGAQPALYGFAPKAFGYASPLPGLPVTITVHDRDPHIPLARVRESIATFDRLGATTRLRVLPGAGHGIDPADVAALRSRLA